MRSHKQRRRAPNRIILVSTALTLLLCAWSTVFSLAGGNDPIRRAIVTVSTPFTTLFDRVGGETYDLLAETPDEESRRRQVEQLQAQLAAERAKVQQLQSIQLENEQLKQYLSLPKTHPELALCQAQRIYTSDTSGRRITLSRGTRDGVSVGMPVLDPFGLLGQVSEVTAHSCKVTTLLDATLFVGVRDARSGITGTLCGVAPGETYATLKYVDANVDHTRELRVGDVIVTAGGSDTYPADLPVGQIVQVGQDAYDRSPYALVRLYARAEDATSLLMIVTGSRAITSDIPEEIPDNEPSEIPSDEPLENEPLDNDPLAEPDGEDAAQNGEEVAS